MSVVVRKCRDREFAPDYITSIGRPAWAGKYVADLSALDLVHILQFCRDEAWRMGWNDKVSNRVDAAHSNVFHQDFLAGYPYQEWMQHYERGVLEQEQFQRKASSSHPAK